MVILIIFEFFNVVVRFSVFIIIIIKFNGKFCFILLFDVIFMLISIVVKNSRLIVSEMILVVVNNIVERKLLRVIYFCLLVSGWVIFCFDKIKKFLFKFWWVVKFGFVVKSKKLFVWSLIFFNLFDSCFLLWWMVIIVVLNRVLKLSFLMVCLIIWVWLVIIILVKFLCNILLVLVNMFSFFMWLRLLSFWMLLEKISLLFFRMIRLGLIGDIRLLLCIIFIKKSFGKLCKWFCFMVLFMSFELDFILVLIIYLW